MINTTCLLFCHVNLAYKPNKKKKNCLPKLTHLSAHIITKCAADSLTCLIYRRKLTPIIRNVYITKRDKDMWYSKTTYSWSKKDVSQVNQQVIFLDIITFHLLFSKVNRYKTVSLFVNILPTKWKRNNTFN